MADHRAGDRRRRKHSRVADVRVGRRNVVQRRTGFGDPNLPEDVLFAWCHANPEKAPAFAARNLPFLTTLDRNASGRKIHSRMLRLIDEFGHLEDVREEIAANIHTFGWSGSTTEYYELFYDPLAELAGHQNRDVRRWATQVGDELKAAFERAKNEDEEREARSEFY